MTDNQTEQFIVKLKLYVRASYPLLWVQTHEETRVINDIALAFDSLKIPIPVYAWDVQQELRKYQKSNDDKKINWLQIPQPLTPPKTDIMGIIKYCSMLPRIGNGRTLIIIKDFHPYIEVAQQVRAIRNLVDTAHAADQTYIFVSPVIKIPIELEKDFQLLDYKLPNDAQLGQILQSLTKDFIAAYPANEEIHSVPRAIELDIIEACKGMTFAESYDACALAAATHGKFNSQFVSTVFEEKIKQVKRHGFIQYLKPTDTFDSIGGLSELKTWIKVRAKAYTEEARKYGLKYPRGILLAGIPGTGNI